MSKDNQIYEMAKATMKHCKIDNQCGSCHWSTCNECLADVLYNAGYRKQSVGECPYCKDRTVTGLPLKTNCDTSRVGCLIAQGDNKKEIIFWSNIGTYGIEINFCPICGAKMKGGAE